MGVWERVCVSVRVCSQVSLGPLTPNRAGSTDCYCPDGARMGPSAVSPCRILSSWPPIAGATVQADPSSWVAVSPRQHFRLLAACPGARCTRYTTQDITSHHRSALQYAHAPQIALPDVSLSPRLGCSVLCTVGPNRWARRQAGRDDNRKQAVLQ